MSAEGNYTPALLNCPLHIHRRPQIGQQFRLMAATSKSATFTLQDAKENMQYMEQCGKCKVILGAELRA